MLKIGDQSIRCGEGVGAFFVADVTMIALTGFVIVAKDAHIIHHIC